MCQCGSFVCTLLVHLKQLQHLSCYFVVLLPNISKSFGHPCWNRWIYFYNNKTLPRIFLCYRKIMRLWSGNNLHDITPLGTESKDGGNFWLVCQGSMLPLIANDKWLNDYDKAWIINPLIAKFFSIESVISQWIILMVIFLVTPVALWLSHWVNVSVICEFTPKKKRSVICETERPQVLHCSRMFWTRWLGQLAWM